MSRLARCAVLLVLAALFAPSTVSARPTPTKKHAIVAVERELSSGYGINDEGIYCAQLTNSRFKCRYEHGLTNFDIQQGYTNGESGIAYVTFLSRGIDVRVIPR